jgi:hypothetical protein
MDRSTLLAVIALVGVFVVFVRQNRLQQELKGKAGQDRTRLVSVAPSSTVPVEVAHYMARIQQHAEKLWWAGQAGNLELAKFYRHEIKEEMEVVAGGNVVDDGVPVSEHMMVYGIRAVDALKDQLATDGLKDFKDRYEALILACNSCHKVTGHPELRMRIPAENRFAGQDFTVQP